MPDTHFSSGPYKTQDIIRTIHISYQPYMPFTQTYSMGLRENSTDPLKANYFRIGPPDVEDTKNSTGGYDGTYPYKLRRQLFGGDTGGTIPPITNVANNKRRLSDMVKAYNNLQGEAQNSISDLGRELAGLLSATYAFDKDAFIREYASPTSRQNTHEIEVNMLSRELDKLLGAGTPVDSNLRDRGDFILTTKTGQGFDILLSRNRNIASYIDHLYQRNVTDGIEGLELSVGTENRKVFMNVATEGLTPVEAVTTLTSHINSVVDEYNRHIATNIGPQMRLLREAGVAPETAFAFEAARESFESNMDQRTHHYMIRQLTDRFLINNFTGYFFQGQLTANSFGIVLLQPTMVGDLPQLQNVTVDDVKIVSDHANIFEGLHQWGASQLSNADKAVLNAAVTRIQGRSSGHAMHQNVIHSIDRYTSAAVSADIERNLELQIGSLGLGSIHRVSMDIATTLRREIEQHFNTPQNKTEFKNFYDKMMKESNKLTKSWFDKAKDFPGQKGRPISEEWRSPAYGWNKGGTGENYNRKKGIGVWSGKKYNAWKEDIGRNFSISPFLQSRRRFTGGKDTAGIFTNEYRE